MPTYNISSLYNSLIELIPAERQKEFCIGHDVFVRDRKLPYTSIITIILSLCVQQRNCGLASSLEQFFAFTRNTALWPNQSQTHESSFSKARAKLTWEAFEDLHKKFTKLAYSIWDDDPYYSWFGMNVFAVDGSKYSLPSTDELREVFDPLSLPPAEKPADAATNALIDSPSEKPTGKPYFPQCTVTTIYDVFRRLPIARSIADVNTSERKQLLNLLDTIPQKSVVIADRGYPSYEVLAAFIQYFSGYFLIRCPASNSFPAVRDFIQSGKDEAIISVAPSQDYKAKSKEDPNAFKEHIAVKAIRIVTLNGSVSVLLTNMVDDESYSTQEIKKLYLKRERIENYYRDEKTYLEIEKFHSKSPNGIRQELYAILVVSVIARILMMHCQKKVKDKTITPRFKHAVMVLAQHMALMSAKDPQRGYELFTELLHSIERVKTYPHRKKRPNQPRICKKPPNKWAEYRGKRTRDKGKA